MKGRAAHSPGEGEAEQGPRQEHEEAEKGEQAELEATGHSGGPREESGAGLQGSYEYLEEKGARQESAGSGGHCFAEPCYVPLYPALGLP